MTPGSDAQREPTPATCTHCGRSERLIAGDGAVVCRVCLLAWGGYARLINQGGVVPVEPAAHESPSVNTNLRPPWHGGYGYIPG